MNQMELWTSDLSIPSGDDQGFLLPFLESKDVRGVRVSRRGEVCVTSCLLSEELKLLPHLLEMKSKTFWVAPETWPRKSWRTASQNSGLLTAMSDSDKYIALRE